MNGPPFVSQVLSIYGHFNVPIHLRNLLTHTLLFRHFLKNLNFELKNTLEYIRTMLSGNAWLFSEINDFEHSRN